MLKTPLTNPPPRDDLPAVHKLREIFKLVYALGGKLSKRDRYGIYLKLEATALETLSLAIEAALTPRSRKAERVAALMVRIELLKQLVRIGQEIGAVEEKRYLAISQELVEASKMSAGWLKYLNSNPPVLPAD